MFDKKIFYTTLIPMKQTILSVIIPMYNASQYIQQCLDSIVVQDGFPDFQIIVIDDGSNDNGADIVQEYSLKYSNIELYKQENQGVSAARNRGMDLARGKYVSFIDADDMVGASYKICDKYLYEPTMDSAHANMMYQNGILDDTFPSAPLGDKEYFMCMIKSAQKNNAEIAMGGKVGIWAEEARITALNYKTNRVFDTKLKDKEIVILQAFERESANFAVYRNDFLKRHNMRFEVDMPLNEDILFCILATLYAKKISTVKDNTYCYNRRSGTLTDYCSFMPSWEAQHRYSAALVQMYGRFMQEIAKYPEYAKIHKKYTYIFATNSCDAITKHLEYFPTAKCASCSKETCNKCDQNKKNITRIKKGLKKLMPNRIQKTQ